jgi:hypothetical protein
LVKTWAGWTIITGMITRPMIIRPPPMLTDPTDPTDLRPWARWDLFLAPSHALLLPLSLSLSHTHSHTHHTPLTIHHSPYTTHHTPLTIHHSPYTTHHTPPTIHHPPCTTHHITIGGRPPSLPCRCG